MYCQHRNSTCELCLFVCVFFFFFFLSNKYTHTHTHKHPHTCIHTHEHPPTNPHTHKPTHPHTLTPSHPHTHPQTHTHTHTHIHTHMHTQTVHINTLRYTQCAYTQTYPHTFISLNCFNNLQERLRRRCQLDCVRHCSSASQYRLQVRRRDRCYAQFGFEHSHLDTRRLLDHCVVVYHLCRSA